MLHRGVLLVENNPALAGSLDLFFSGRGFRTTVAATAAEARRNATLASPDAIVIGHRDGVIDAADLTPELCALLAPREPAIIVTARLPSSRPLDAVAAVLPRACHPRAILQAIKAAFRRRAKA